MLATSQKDMTLPISSLNVSPWRASTIRLRRSFGSMLFLSKTSWQYELVKGHEWAKYGLLSGIWKIISSQLHGPKVY